MRFLQSEIVTTATRTVRVAATVTGIVPGQTQKAQTHGERVFVLRRRTTATVVIIVI